MQGRSYQWIVCVLAAVTVLSVASAANAQIAPDAGYQYARTSAAVTDGYTAGYTALPANFNGGKVDLAAEVAELREWKESVQKKEAAAKKKKAGAPTVKAGGRIFLDTAMFSQNAASVAQVNEAQNGTEFRTVRLFLKGDAFHIVNYKMEFDFASTSTIDTDETIGQVAFKDVYMGISELPILGHVRVGHFKEPFGMEELISSKYITFMERPLGDTGVFVPGRNIGVMAFDCSENERMTWAVGGFINNCPDEPPRYQSDSGQGSVTARLTYLPWYDEATNGRGLLHIGAAYSYRANGNDTLRLRTRPESHMAPYVLDTDTLHNVPNFQIYSGELAFLYGSFCAQAECFGVTLNRNGGLGNQNFSGGYVNLSYFLTGENRVYNRPAGTFNSRIQPFGNFFRVRDENGYVQTGIGAWEVAYRCSHGDLIDIPVNGGRTTDHTVGVNWYLNPYMRMMFNYIHSTTDDADAQNGNLDIVQMRAQIDF